jgi:hypothetical protein
MKRNLVASVAAVGAVLLSATMAFATVTFDANSGVGFVGKGDVQMSFGWNNAQLQSRASSLSFDYIDHRRFDFTCVWTSGNDRHQVTHAVDQFRTSHLNNSVAYEARSQKQVSGFILNGYSSTSGNSVDPLTLCHMDNGEATVENLVITGVGLQLIVTYGGSSVGLWSAN